MKRIYYDVPVYARALSTHLHNSPAFGSQRRQRKASRRAIEAYAMKDPSKANKKKVKMEIDACLCLRSELFPHHGRKRKL